MELPGLFILISLIIMLISTVWVFYDAPKYKINRYFAIIGIIIAPLIGLILYLLITRTKIRNIKLTRKNKILLAIAIIIKFSLTFLFPKQHEHMEHVYLYGIPDPFFTLYSREFHIMLNSNVPFTFSFNPLQMLVNILIIYFLLWLLDKLYTKIKNKEKLTIIPALKQSPKVP